MKTIILLSGNAFGVDDIYLKTLYALVKDGLEDDDDRDILWDDDIRDLRLCSPTRTYWCGDMAAHAPRSSLPFGATFVSSHSSPLVSCRFLKRRLTFHQLASGEDPHRY